MALGLMDLSCTYSEFIQLIKGGRFNSVSYSEANEFLCWYHSSSADYYRVDGGNFQDKQVIATIRSVCEQAKVEFNDLTELRCDKIERTGLGQLEPIDNGQIYFCSSVVAENLKLNDVEGLEGIDFNLSPYWAIKMVGKDVSLEQLTEHELNSYKL